MKKNLLAIVLCFLTVSMFAQRAETLLGNARARGAFGAVITEFGSFNNNDISTSHGGGGGIIIDNFFIGAYGLGSGDWNDFEDGKLEMGHGGFWLGYTSPHYRLVHLYSSVKLGWGAIDLDLDDFNGSDNIFVATPEVGAELNLTRWLKVAGTVGYRNVTGVKESTGTKNSDYSGMVGTLTFRIGAFGRWREDRRSSRKKGDREERVRKRKEW